MYRRVHGDVFNVPRSLLPGVQLQIKFTKSKKDFYIVSAKADTGAVFKFLDATLHARQVKPSSTTQLAHAKALEKVNAWYDMTRVALKTFTFGAGSKSVSINNAVRGILPKRLLFKMLRNTDSTGSMDTNPYIFRHFGLNHFVMYVNGRQLPSEGLSLNTASEKTCTMAYQTLFNGLGIHNGNKGIQITPTQFIKGSFMLVFDLTPDGCASDGHTSLPDNGNIRIELKFDEALAEAVTILLYQEFDASIQIDRLRNVTVGF
jgi:hypothetical protein